MRAPEHAARARNARTDAHRRASTPRQDEHFVCFVPFAALSPYTLWIVPKADRAQAQRVSRSGDGCSVTRLTGAREREGRAAHALCSQRHVPRPHPGTSTRPPRRRSARSRAGCTGRCAAYTLGCRRSPLALSLLLRKRSCEPKQQHRNAQRVRGAQALCRLTKRLLPTSAAGARLQYGHPHRRARDGRHVGLPTRGVL